MILAVFLGLRLISGPEDNWLCRNGEWVRHGNPSSPKPTGLCSGANDNYWLCRNGAWEKVGEPVAAKPTSGCGTAAAVAIKVSAPESGAIVGEKFAVSGTTNDLKDSLVVRFKDAAGGKVFEEKVELKTTEDGQLTRDSVTEANFSHQIDLSRYPTVRTGEYVLEFLQYASERGGEEAGLVTLPIRFLAKGNLSVKAFFNNNNLDPDITCEKVFAVSRETGLTETLDQPLFEAASLALNELLKGPLEAEKRSGYFTNINQSVKINSLTINQGVARVDFSEELGKNVAGSCRVTAIRSQISETLKQFREIKEVIISINGKSEEILQP